MIHFRCPSCGRRHARAETQAGQRFACACQETLRVPRNPGQSPLYRSWGDRALVFVIYAGGGGVLGFFLGVGILLSWLYWFDLPAIAGWPLILTTTVVGLLAGGLSGEAGVNWIGRMIRSHETD
jgi:hypothetical protein